MEDHKTVTPKSCGGRKEVVFEIVVGKKIPRRSWLDLKLIRLYIKLKNKLK